MLLTKNQENFEESFETLGLEDSVMRAIQRLKFKEPTEIQKKAIPLIMTGKATTLIANRERPGRMRQDRNR